MPGLVLLVVGGVAYDVIALDRGWETISAAVRRVIRNPAGSRVYSALRRHFEED